MKKSLNTCLILEQMIKGLIEEKLHETLHMPLVSEVAVNLKKANRNNHGLIDKIFGVPGAVYANPVEPLGPIRKDFEAN